MGSDTGAQVNLFGQPRPSLIWLYILTPSHVISDISNNLNNIFSFSIPQQKKRALAEIDTNAQPQPAAKKASTGKGKDKQPTNDKPENQANDTTGKASTKKSSSQWLDRQPSNLYICIDRSFEDFEADFREKRNNKSEKGGAFQAYKSAREKKNSMCPKLAEEHRGWGWTIMVGAWKQLCETCVRASKCDPDNFDMYVYNDYYGYAIGDIIEGFVVFFTPPQLYCVLCLGTNIQCPIHSS